MSPMLIALVILLLTVALFIFEPVPLMVTSIAASLLYAFLGLIETKDIFASYATNTNVLMVAMMIIGASMFHLGLSELIGKKMAKYIKGSEKRAILVTMFASCALSSVCTNIGLMTALNPLCTAMCLSSGIPP